jgi:hypothetical protein
MHSTTVNLKLGTGHFEIVRVTISVLEFYLCFLWNPERQHALRTPKTPGIVALLLSLQFVKRCVKKMMPLQC